MATIFLLETTAKTHSDSLCTNQHRCETHPSGPSRLPYLELRDTVMYHAAMFRRLGNSSAEAVSQHREAVQYGNCGLAAIKGLDFALAWHNPTSRPSDSLVAK